MPELPEVETLRRNLERTLLGRVCTAVELRLERVFFPWDGLTARDVVGQRVVALRRRAKFLVLDLARAAPAADAATARSLVFHLRLAGQLVHRAADGTTLAAGGHPVPSFDAPLPHKSTHAIFRFDDGSVLYYTDIRQFGRIWLRPTELVEELIAAARLGPEPLEEEFDPERFAARLKRHPRIAIKPLLLGQRVVGGLGNIYVDESLFAAGIHPLRPAGSLSPAEATRLHGAIRAVLDRAVTEGVAEIRNGRANPEREFPLVHGRAGRPCPRCGAAIVKTRVGGRGTYTCPTCQPLG